VYSPRPLQRAQPSPCDSAHASDRTRPSFRDPIHATSATDDLVRANGLSSMHTQLCRFTARSTGQLSSRGTLAKLKPSGCRCAARPRAHARCSTVIWIKSYTLTTIQLDWKLVGPSFSFQIPQLTSRRQNHLVLRLGVLRLLRPNQPAVTSVVRTCFQRPADNLAAECVQDDSEIA
jgi:hypothetical protein